MYISIYIVIKTFITQVNENAMLSPGHVTKIHGARKDRVRKSSVYNPRQHKNISSCD